MQGALWSPLFPSIVCPPVRRDMRRPFIRLRRVPRSRRTLFGPSGTLALFYRSLANNACCKRRGSCFESQLYRVTLAGVVARIGLESQLRFARPLACTDGIFPRISLQTDRPNLRRSRLYEFGGMLTSVRTDCGEPVWTFPLILGVTLMMQGKSA